MRTAKKISVIAGILISLLSAFYFSVYKFSPDAFDNIRSGRKSVSASPSDGLTLSNWEQTGENTFVSAEDCQIVFTEPIGGYVKNLKLKGELDDYNDLSVQIFFTETDGENFTEEKSIWIAPNVKNNDIYFSIEKYIYRIRIDFYAAPGRTAEIRSLTLNPKTLNVDSSVMIMTFGIPFIICSVIIIIVFYSKQIKEHFSGINKYRFLLHDLVSRDIKTKYRRSALGVLWSVLNPLLMMLVITAVFANIFRFDIKDFPIYYLTGSLIFNFVSEATSFSLNAVLGASGLIKKVYIPKYIFPLEKCIFAFVNMLFSFVAVIIVFIILKIPPHLTILMFPIPMLYAFVFALGLSLILSALNVFFRDTTHLWGVFVTAWMYLTPIIYPMNILPGWMTNIVKLNPLYYYVEYMRDVLIYGNIPDTMTNMVCVVCSLIMLILGIVVFRKKQDKFILYI